MAHLQLEAAHFVEHRAHVLMRELRQRELVVKEAVAEAELFPHIHFFAQGARVLKPRLVLDLLRVEKALWDLNVSLILDELVEAAECLRDAGWALRIAASEPEVGDAWDQPDEGLFRAKNLLYQTQVTVEGALGHTHPLVGHDWRLFHRRASLHHLSHLGDGYHAEAAGVDACHAPGELLYVTELVCLDKNDSCGVLGLEDLHDHKRVPAVELINQLVRQSHHQLPLHSFLHFKPPQLRILVRRQTNPTIEIAICIDVHEFILVERDVVLN
mmetsp:Transcript_4992/g.6660  ORF Transcript_4992/g.6660 Transcript_4992/m.6660 type:complete len:271 (-) Transcript_4992:754-1566(-)